MSRSYRKNPIIGNCSTKGQKRFKKLAHKAERTMLRDKLITEQYDSVKSPKIYGNEWDSPRDGKHWLLIKNQIYKWMGK